MTNNFKCSFFERQKNIEYAARLARLDMFWTFGFFTNFFATHDGRNPKPSGNHKHNIRLVLAKTFLPGVLPLLFPSLVRCCKFLLERSTFFTPTIDTTHGACRVYNSWFRRQKAQPVFLNLRNFFC